jgi:hypothetical protein
MCGATNANRDLVAASDPILLAVAHGELALACRRGVAPRPRVERFAAATRWIRSPRCVHRSATSQ